MGNISQYQRKRLASARTPVPAQDKSGQILGQAMTELGGTLQAKAIKERDQYTDVQANMGLMQFAVSFQKYESQAKREMANNPTEAPEQVLQDGQTMMQEFASSIPDSMVRQKFMRKASAFVKTSALKINKWAIDKQAENADIAAKDYLRSAAIVAGETLTVQDYKTSIDGIKRTMDDKETGIPDSVMNDAEKHTFWKENAPKVLESHLLNRAKLTPEALKEDIENGEYKKFEEYTDKLKRKAIRKADQAIRREEKEISDAQDENYAKLLQARMRGDLTFPMIDSFATAENPKETIGDLEAISLKEGLVDKVETTATRIAKSDKDAADYVRLIDDVVEGKVDRAKILRQVNKVFSDGILLPEESEFLMELTQPLRDAQTQTKWERWTQGVETVGRVVRSIVSNKAERTVLEAQSLRKIIFNTKEGIDPQVATKQVIQDIKRRQVIKNDPSLVDEDDPVDASYRKKAIQLLEQSGKKTDDKAVNRLAEMLKQRGQ